MPDPRINEAITLMNNYAERTGLVSEQPRRRYLWTDAFAVCNYLGLARSSGEQGYTERALQLVDQDWVSTRVNSTQHRAGCASVKAFRSEVPANPSTSIWSGTATASISII